MDNTEIFMVDEMEIQLQLSNDEIYDYLGRKELYYCIDSNWCEMDRMNNLIIPKLPCCDYR